MLYDLTCKWDLKKKKSKTHRNREKNSGCQGLGVGRNGEMLVKGYILSVIR